MGTLLYLDLLGVKARWQRGGADAAERAFWHLERFVRIGLSCIPPDRARLVRGGIQSDAAALVFQDPRDALEAARNTFQAAFLYPQSSDDERFWLRGVVLPCPDEAVLWSQEPAGGGLDNAFVSRPCGPLLDAITVEQSGFKGMRLLIDRAAVPGRDRAKFRVWLSPTNPFKCVRRLWFSDYPDDPGDGFGQYVDLLWMVPDDLREWPSQQRRIADRFRWSAPGHDELVHAAATLVVFESVGAILESVRKSTTEPELGQRRLTSGATKRLALVASQVEELYAEARAINAKREP